MSHDRHATRKENSCENIDLLLHHVVGLTLNVMDMPPHGLLELQTVVEWHSCFRTAAGVQVVTPKTNDGPALARLTDDTCSTRSTSFSRPSSCDRKTMRAVDPGVRRRTHSPCWEISTGAFSYSGTRNE